MLVIQFPPDEIADIKIRLEKAKSVLTTRIDQEKGKYHFGDRLLTPWGTVLEVTHVGHGRGVNQHPHLETLTPQMKQELADQWFDLVYLKVVQ